MPKLINLTPHKVRVYNHNEEFLFELPACSDPLRLSTREKTVGKIKGAPLKAKIFDIPTNLPPKQKDTYYVVSGLCIKAVKKRKDFIIPSDPVRNEDGEVIGCKSFCLNK